MQYGITSEERLQSNTHKIMARVGVIISSLLRSVIVVLFDCGFEVARLNGELPAAEYDQAGSLAQSHRSSDLHTKVSDARKISIGILAQSIGCRTSTGLQRND
jgi:hypothetical protein